MIVAGTLVWSTLQQGDQRIYRVVRVFADPRYPDAGPQAELETVYRADLTLPAAVGAGSKSKPISRNCGFLVPVTAEELNRRIGVLRELSGQLEEGTS